MGSVKGCPHVSHAPHAPSRSGRGHSLKPHVEEPFRVSRILNADHLLCLLRGKRTEQSTRARACLRSRQTRRPPLAPPCSACSCRGGSKRLHWCKLPPAQHVPNELQSPSITGKTARGAHVPLEPKRRFALRLSKKIVSESTKYCIG